ncbi:MAG: hypothetical protein PHT48_10705 [Dechloromonas sp.]|nr:hypothetical protein [Dechloromonas sp.]
MKHQQIVTTLFCLACLLVMPLAAVAEAPSAEQVAEWDRRLEQAAARQAEAERLQGEAEAVYAAAYSDCLKKFLVNACREDARQVNLAVRRQSRTMISEARAEVRDVRKAQIAARQALPRATPPAVRAPAQ